MNDLLSLADEARLLPWKQVSDRALAWVEKHGADVDRLQFIAESLPRENLKALWYEADHKAAAVELHDADNATKCAWMSGLLPAVPFVYTHGSPYDKEAALPEGFWVPIDRPQASVFLKEAFSWHNLAQIFGMAPSWASNFLPTPSPAAAMLAGGLAGAGLGYGAGTLAEGLVPGMAPNTRRRWALLGGLAGALPGVAYLGANHWSPFTAGALGVPEDSGAQYGPGQPRPAVESTHGLLHDGQPIPADKSYEEALNGPAKMAESLLDEDDWVKAAEQTGLWGVPEPRGIPVREVQEVIWHDPFMPVPLQAALAGLVQTTGHMRGSPIVTPSDMARLTMGMGSGYMAGLLAGKLLGGFMGLPQSTQRKLQQAGTLAGAAKALVPVLFPEP